MFLLYSLGFNADLFSEEYCVYGTLDNWAESSLCMPVLQQISWSYQNEWLIFSVENLRLLLSRLVINTEYAVFHVICCFQNQGIDIRTLRNVGVTRNCVVQDRLIFVMYKAENSYNET
jgi:hypothetical protein